MIITFHSIINSIIFNSLFISILCCSRKKIRFTQPSDVSLFIFLYAIGMLRVLFPVEFPLTTGIPCKGIYSKLLDLLIHRDFHILSLKFKPIHLIGFGLCSVSIYNLVKLTLSFMNSDLLLLQNKFCDQEQLCRTKQEIQKIYNHLPKCDIIVCPSISVPIVAGLVKKVIVLPDIKYTDSELYYILLHEYTHIVNRDIYIKLIIELYCNLFWWIPYKKFLKEDKNKR